MYLSPRFSVTEQTKADRFIGKRQKKVYKVATNLKKQTDGSKNLQSNTLLFRYKTEQYYDYSGVLASELGGRRYTFERACVRE